MRSSRELELNSWRLFGNKQINLLPSRCRASDTPLRVPSDALLDQNGHYLHTTKESKSQQQILSILIPLAALDNQPPIVLQDPIEWIVLTWIEKKWTHWKEERENEEDHVRIEKESKDRSENINS